ncbi:NUDIX domain-containing protein [Nocardia mikamii]|uniref:NUDIX domain-containing protein n=1 Tax=Nocardia mikamii TaxID=508464 RepID=UPI0007A3A63A|nr:NUDIX domain-containing protein [Nocardia mikamii]
MPNIVAAVLVSGNRLGLLKRSRRVEGDPDRWHCVTGYLPSGSDPLAHAHIEINEETGLAPVDLSLVRRGKRLELRDLRDNAWHVFPFLFDTPRSDLILNWEHDEYRWVRPAEMNGLTTVPWLRDVLHAVGRPDLHEEGAYTG